MHLSARLILTRPAAFEITEIPTGTEATQTLDRSWLLHCYYNINYADPVAAAAHQWPRVLRRATEEPQRGDMNLAVAFDALCDMAIIIFFFFRMSLSIRRTVPVLPDVAVWPQRTEREPRARPRHR